MRVGTLRGLTNTSEIDAGIDAVHSILEQALHEIKTLEFELSPPALSAGVPFDQSISWLVESLRQKRGLKSELVIDNNLGVLSGELKLVLFKAIRELLINVVKHAAVNEAFIDIRQIGQNIHATVLDHGEGFDIDLLDVMDPRNKGFGLFSIQERFADFGGSAEVVSEPGKGTKVLLVIPIDRSVS